MMRSTALAIAAELILAAAARECEGDEHQHQEYPNR